MKFSTKCLVALAASALSLQVRATDSAEDIYNACSAVLDAMINVSKGTFQSSVDSDSIMTNLVCPLTQDISNAINEGIKSTVDGTNDPSFTAAQNEVHGKAQEFIQITSGDNKYVCPSLNTLSKEISNLQRRDTIVVRDAPGAQTSIKDTYDVLGTGIYDASGACIAQSSVTDVICPVVSDLVKAVDTLAGIVDQTANAQQLVQSVVSKGNDMVKSVSCPDTSKYKSALSELVNSAGLNSQTLKATDGSSSPSKTEAADSDSTTTVTATSTTSDDNNNNNKPHVSTVIVTIFPSQSAEPSLVTLTSTLEGNTPSSSTTSCISSTTTVTATTTETPTSTPMHCDTCTKRHTVTVTVTVYPSSMSIQPTQLRSVSGQSAGAFKTTSAGPKFVPSSTDTFSEPSFTPIVTVGQNTPVSSWDQWQSSSPSGTDEGDITVTETVTWGVSNTRATSTPEVTVIVSTNSAGVVETLTSTETVPWFAQTGNGALRLEAPIGALMAMIFALV